MRIAVPIAAGKLCLHFGHCEQFLFLDVDESARTITGKTALQPPPHEPGNLPPWVAAQGAGVVICGGMGMRAQQLFEQSGVRVITGAQPVDPERLVMDWLDGALATGPNACGEDQGGHGGHGGACRSHG